MLIMYPHTMTLPDQQTLNWVTEKLGAKEIISLEYLQGGRSHSNFLVTILLDNSNLCEVVLRRWTNPDSDFLNEFPPEREVTILQHLKDFGFSLSPRLIGYNFKSGITDFPALLITYLPGFVPTPNEGREKTLCNQLADVLHRIHQIPPSKNIPRYRPYNPDLAGVPPAYATNNFVWEKALKYLSHNWSLCEKLGDTLIHRDFHPKNCLWNETTITGVVDWTYASIGMPEMDLAHMRWNLALDYTISTANDFLDAYMRRSSLVSTTMQKIWDVRTVVDLFPDPTNSMFSPVQMKRLEEYLEVVLAGIKI